MGVPIATALTNVIIESSDCVACPLSERMSLLTTGTPRDALYYDDLAERLGAGAKSGASQKPERAGAR